MRNLIFCIWLALYCTCAWAVESAVPSNDRSLDAPVTLAVKGEALTDIMTMLTKRSGVKLRVTKEIADRKATIFVDSMPLKDVMNGLATISGYRWSVVKNDAGKVFELWESQRARLAQEAALAGAMGAAWQEFDARARETVRVSEGDTSAMKSELDRLRAQITAEKRMPTTEERLRMDLLAGATDNVSDTARLYLSLPPDIVAVLHSGARAYFDTDTSEMQWRVAPEMARRIDARFAGEDMFKGYSPGSYNIMLDCRASMDYVNCQSHVTCYRKLSDGSEKSNGASGGGLGPIVHIPVVEPVHAVTKLPNCADDGTLSREVSFSARELADEADLYGQMETSAPIYANRSDILSLLHRKTGIQVLSDHFSGWLGCKPGEKQTITQILDGLRDRIEPKSSPDWGWDGRSVFIREHYPYEHDAMEFPNRVLKLWQTTLAEKRHWDLDSLALLAGINGLQSTTWAERTEWFFLVRGVDYAGALTSPVDWCRQALDFYGHLSDAQKRRVLTNGVRTAELTMPQVEKLLKCFEMTKPDWGRLDPDTRRVGLYKSGLRIDRPDPKDQMPVLVRVEKRAGGDFLVEAQTKSSLHDGYKRIAAPSAADAWKEALKIWPDLPTRPCFFGQDAGYVLVMVFQDGTKQEIPMPVFEPVPAPGTEVRR